MFKLNKEEFDWQISGTTFSLKKYEMNRVQEIFSIIDKDRTRLHKFLPWLPYIKTVEDEKNYIQHSHLNWEKKIGL